jgi:hypothetical protein
VLGRDELLSEGEKKRTKEKRKERFSEKKWPFGYSIKYKLKIL